VERRTRRTSDTSEGIESHPYYSWETEADAIAALDSSRTNLGTEHLDTIACMDDVADIYVGKVRNRDLEPHLEELLDIKWRILGPGHYSTTRSMSQKGQLLYQQARYDEAREVQAWVVQAQERYLGTDSPLTLDSMWDLVKTYTKLERFDESDELVLQSIEKSKRVFGEDHPNTLRAIQLQAINAFKKGNYEKAEKLLMHVLEASEKTDHAQMYRLLCDWVGTDLVQVYFAKGEPDKAEKYLTRILGNMIASRPSADYHRVTIMGAIASVFYSERRLDDAEALYADGMESATQLFGTTKNTFRPMLGAQLARIYHMKERFGEARQLMAECAEDLLRSLGPQDPWTIGAFKTL
jgi:hypothetical protein